MNNRNVILAELQEISLLLHTVKLAEQKPGVPQGYFEKLDEEIFSHLQEPSLGVLPGLKKNKNIGVPASYFENFGDRLMDKIHHQEKEIAQGKLEAPEKNIRIIFFRRLVFAASILAVVFLGIKLFDKNPAAADDCMDTLACLTQEEIRAYVNANIDEFEAEQIQEAYLPEIEAAALENIVPGEEPATTTIDEKEIEKYIEENPAMIDFEDASTDIF